MRFALVIATILALMPACIAAQDAATNAKPAEHVVGTITAADSTAQTVTVKEDGSGQARVIQLRSTRTLLKVSPGAKDLKAAVRISSSDLAVGDRVDIRGSKEDADPTAIMARSVVLMSSRELQQAHQSEASAWQRSTAGTVTAVDPANKKITLNVRTAEGPKSVVADATSAAFTRYSPENPKSAIPSQFSDIQPGDQVKIIGEKGADGSSLVARKVYSGTFKTIAGTVSSIASEGNSFVVKDLSNKQQVTIALSEDASIHKLPPMMAMMLARRFNPDLKTADTANGAGAPAGAAGAPPYGAKAGEAGSAGPGARHSADDGGQQPNAASGTPGPGGGARGGRMANGDLSQILDRLPKIAVSDLKPGDAVVVSGSPSASSKSTLRATSIIAGVEPIFQAAPGRQAQSLGDWGSSLGGGAAMDAGAPPQ